MQKVIVSAASEELQVLSLAGNLSLFDCELVTLASRHGIVEAAGKLKCAASSYTVHSFGDVHERICDCGDRVTSV